VLKRIREAKPEHLFIIADGPENDSDKERCQATRAVVENVDWPCKIHRNYADENMGCRTRVSSGLDWVFENVERAVILEDDCVPDPTFFTFCRRLLEKYENQSHIMTISGTNYQRERRTVHSYYFSRYMHCWGWATWRDAWRQFDHEMSTWPTIRDQKWLSQIFVSRSSASYWRDIFERVHSDEIDSWAYVWQYSIWMRGGLNVIPEVNLVENIGFGDEATHTKSNKNVDTKTDSMDDPIRHPDVLVRHRDADYYTQHSHYQTSLANRIVNKLRKWNLLDT